MIVAVVTAAFVLGQVVSAWLFGRAIQNVQREHGRREDMLVNQMCNLAGRPWAPPPADEWTPPAPVEDAGRYVPFPDQLPDPAFSGE